MTNKGSITEENISTLLQRYSATAVLSLLQEVANFPSSRIDWEVLVKKSSTGITNAREYQMLWRHLAYRDSLLDRVDDGAQPLDDESDLESELEVVPAVDNETSVEAAACVKVLMASGIPSETHPNGSTVDAPLAINMPDGQASRVLSESQQAVMQGTNITVPISVQKQPLSNMSSADGLEATGSGSGNLANKRKRKPWSKAEDLELIAAVQKCGEGSWANILKGEFKGDRTASQLSQRWAIIRKRQGNANVKGSTTSGPQLSPAQLAARHAMSLALDMPHKNLTSGASGATSSNGLGNSLLSTTAAINGSSVVGSSAVQEQQQSQHISGPTKSSPGESSCAMAKSRLPSKKSPPKMANMSPDSMGLKAAAVAAGARIATPSDAASIIMAAQAKNAVRVITTGGSIVKGSVPGGTVQPGLHSNVHYIRTGLATQPLSSQSNAVSGASPSVSVKAVPQSMQRTPSALGIASNLSSQQTDAIASTIPAEVQIKQEVKSEEEVKFQKMNNMPKHTVEEDGSNQVRGDTAPAREETLDQITVNNLNCLTDPQTAPKEQDIVSRAKVDYGQNANFTQDEKHALAKEKCGDAAVNEKESVSHGVLTNKEGEMVKAEAGVQKF